jgi:hypothetical protein
MIRGSEGGIRPIARCDLHLFASSSNNQTQMRAISEAT